MALGQNDAPEKSAAREIIHLHVADKEVSHPEVFTHFCFDRNFVADRVEAGNDKPLVLLVQMTLELPDGNTREERMIIPDVLNVPGRFIPFPKPGEWQVSAYVVQIDSNARGKYSTFRQLRDRFLSRRRDEFYYDLSLAHQVNGERDFWKIAQMIDEMSGYNDAVKYKGAGEIEIIMPADAFAPPPPKWLDSWVRAYTPKSKPIDECDFRRRVIASLFFQPIPYAIWESAKRLFTIVVGLWMLVFGGYKGGVTVMKRAFTPQIVFAFPSLEVDEAAKNSYYRTWPRYLTPFKLVGYAAIAWFVWMIRGFLTAVVMGIWNILVYLATHLFSSGELWMTILTWTASIAALVALVYFGAKAYIAYLVKTEGPRLKAREERELKREQEWRAAEEVNAKRRKEEAEAVRSGKVEVLAVCGPDDLPTDRSKKILRKSISLQVSALKRNICREYA